MQKETWKTFRIDDDVLTVPFHYDRDTTLLLGQFPEFEEKPRYTPHGRPWKNIISTGCPYAAGDYDDCGSCPCLVKADSGDIIGVCFHEKMHRGAAPEKASPSCDIKQPTDD